MNTKLAVFKGKKMGSWRNTASFPCELTEHTEERGSDMTVQKLTESSSSIIKLEERKSDGKIVARGEYGRVGVPTQNGRIYSEKLMQREINRLMEDLKGRKVLGELDHPADGKTSLLRVSHLITNLKIVDGVVIGESEILGTPAGKTLRALLDGEVAIGVSSRGFGSTKPTTGQYEGEEVQEDFVLKTYDFVYDPAVKTAYPEIFTEDVDDPTAAEMFLNEFPDIAQSLTEAAKKDAIEKAKDKAVMSVDEAVKAAEDRVRKEMTEKFEKNIAQSVVEARTHIADELKEEFASDPEIGAAKAALAHIAEVVGVYRSNPDEEAVRDALKAKEIEVSEATRERDAALEKLQEATYALFVERKAGTHPMIGTIRNLLKKTNAESLEDVQDRLESILKDLPDVQEESVDKAVAEELEEENEALRHQLSLLESKVGEIEKKLKRAVELGEEIDAQRVDAEKRAEEAGKKAEIAEKAQEAAELEAYKHEQVGGYANSRELLSLIEDTSSRDKVDKLVEKNGSHQISDGNLRNMRETIGRGTHERSGELNEEIGKQRSDEKIFGRSSDELSRLAGI